MWAREAARRRIEGSQETAVEGGQGHAVDVHVEQALVDGGHVVPAVPAAVGHAVGLALLVGSLVHFTGSVDALCSFHDI